jgi:hypothetical protein
MYSLSSLQAAPSLRTEARICADAVSFLNQFTHLTIGSTIWQLKEAGRMAMPKMTHGPLFPDYRTWSDSILVGLGVQKSELHRRDAAK